MAIQVEPHQCPWHQSILVSQGPINEISAEIAQLLAMLKNYVMLIISKAITCTLAIEETQETTPNEPQCFPGWANNVKHNKNIININGIFVVGLIFYFTLALGISSRFGLITISQGQLYFFVFFCCIPILLPAIYFVRNPKHLVSVLQDHNFM